MNPAARMLLILALLAAAPAAAGASLSPRLALPPPDVEAVLAADALRAGPQPYRFAVPIPVRVSPATHGAWHALDAGRAVWTLTVSVPGAKNLNFGFTRFSLPPGAALKVAAPDGADLRGPYAGTRTQLWTPVIRGDTAVFELIVPVGLQGTTTLELTSVNYGFRGFGAKDETSQAKSGACNVDVVCPEGDAWRNEIRSVARMSIGGAFLCTGQMMNNTAQDFTPYFLSAAHCLGTEVEAQTTTFYWNYETSECGSRRTDGSLEQTSVGATLRATSKGASLSAPDLGPDFTLLELLEQPPAGYRVYYSGWDNRDIAPLGVTAIHHPAGDEKRISFEYDQTEVTAYGESPGTTLSSLLPTHLRIADWDLGTTEGGSSGSGIWNSEHRLVGQLSGGSAACGNNSPDWYGRFHMDWNDVSTPFTSVATWLDPLSSGAQVLDGADPNGIDLSRKNESGIAAVFGGAVPGAGLALLALLAALRQRGRA